MEAAGITIVIVTRGMPAMLDVCLQHAAAALRRRGTGEADRVVVVDNATPEPVAPACRHAAGVQWLRFDTHHSFAAACNAGIRRCPNAFYLMLNNDVILDEGLLLCLQRHMAEEPRLGVCGALLLFPDGRVQHFGIRFGGADGEPYHWLRTQSASAVPERLTEFQAVTGACMLLRGTMLDEVGLFDEEYPFGWEDADLCLRAAQRGWKVASCPHAPSVHFESATRDASKTDPPSRAVFLRKWQGKFGVGG
jgi:GT2 family glycosyltransferase